MIRGFMFAQKVEKDSEGNPYFVFDKDGESVQAYPDAQLPEYQTKNAAGADFFCAEEVTIPSIWVGLADILIAKGEDLFVRAFSTFKNDLAENQGKRLKPTKVHTGIKASMGDDEVLELYNRSSNPGKLGMVLANGVGVVDSDYFGSKDNDGEICFAFYNFMPWSVTIKVGDRIGQGVFKKYLRPEVGLRVKDCVRTGGFGSTNK